VLRVTYGGDAAEEIEKLIKEYNSLMQDKKSSIDSVDKNWFNRGISILLFV
jgi:hypothetical protein